MLTITENRKITEVLLALLQVGDEILVINTIKHFYKVRISQKCKITKINDQYIYYMYPDQCIYKVSCDYIYSSTDSKERNFLFTYHNPSNKIFDKSACSSMD